jgi:hypothetical protein
VFVSPESAHQTVRKSYRNAVGFRPASGSPFDGCLVGFSQFYSSTTSFRLRACLKKERGCVEDQPQHAAISPATRKLEACCG